MHRLFTSPAGSCHSMEKKSLKLLTFFLLVLVLAGRSVNVEGVSYDYSVTIECLEEPLKPQYGGGMIVNPEFTGSNGGINGWSMISGNRMIDSVEIRESKSGNRFAVSRNPPYQILQNLNLNTTMLYTFSAWVQLGGIGDEQDVPVSAVFRTNDYGYNFVAGTVMARSGCWSMMKGGITVNVTGSFDLFFEVRNISSEVEIWIDSVSLQAFTDEEWASHRRDSIENLRKKRVRFLVKDSTGNPQANSTIGIIQKRSGFPFGCAISSQILTNPGYANWYTSRGFTVTTFENEMKWYDTEKWQGHEDYGKADRMLAFAKHHGLAVRGHAVFWDDPKYQTAWVKSLSSNALRIATERRINSVMNRYKGNVIAWDVVNENLHFSFLENKLGRGVSQHFYQRAADIDRHALLFMNEFNTLAQPGDRAVTPAKYLQKINIMSRGKNLRGRLAIGLESHFNPNPSLPYVRSALDTISAHRFPVWLTEVDVSSGPSQARDLENVLREGHAHPGVHGIVIWGAWRPQGCYAMCLTDNNFRNLPTGDVVDKLIREWRHSPISTISVKTDSHGVFETDLFHGEYSLSLPTMDGNSSFEMNFSVVPDQNSDTKVVEFVVA
ncbi:endo-1,4-beta-xylanase, family GH10 [Zostera marina]|uniref:Endo-1,4-beta-xylanase, family GH10 n=1 Tax=Zostera marina TaxID=29655 RepID=A0A0K9PSM5_ZOSMR|nr:endo-1,4-beta-xylanase, family GH10 [Zostera marina]